MSEWNGRGPVLQFLAWLVMAAGVLIALTTGACTLYVLAALAASGSGDYGWRVEWVLLSLVIGGVPFLIGLALFFGGRRLGRPSSSRTPTTPSTERDDEPATGA